MTAANSVAPTTEPKSKGQDLPLVLLPGEYVCNWLGVEDPDSRMLLRMFVNLSIYGKIGGSIAFWFL
ncbi:MAG: hypothetical protein AAGI06_04225 [Pseudomonadota bacterium]